MDSGAVVEVSLIIAHIFVDFFFFFQAEDGIRDVAVTGVQTCALPIFRKGHDLGPGAESWRLLPGKNADHGRGSRATAHARASERGAVRDRRASRRPEIGRASCRERV